MQQCDVAIAGAGVIGLSLALELRRRGREVLVVDHGTAGVASRAAAGMLAAHDPHNPPELQPLADLALDLYPAYLDEICSRSGRLVSVQTEHVLEPDAAGPSGHALLPALAPGCGNFTLRPEQSLDPRELHHALQAATQDAGVVFQKIGATQRTSAESLSICRQSVDCTGAWSPFHTRPAKGQMLRVRLPNGTLQLPGNGSVVIRTEHIYLVPRLDGTTVIGASVEDAGFDLAMQDNVLADLRARASALIPAVAVAPELERWAGLRPRTADDLPILGRVASGHYVANGLFRNGILLAPAVARVIAEMLTGEASSVPLDVFSPQRPALKA